MVRRPPGRVEPATPGRADADRRGIEQQHVGVGTDYQAAAVGLMP